MTKFALINCDPDTWKERLDATTRIDISLASLITDSMKLIEGQVIEAESAPRAQVIEVELAPRAAATDLFE